jgi:diaminopimelate epimerase
MSSIDFAKMHGLGNCFVLVDDRRGAISKTAAAPELARAVCERNTGLGADGLIALRPAERPDADLAMRIWNEDGSAAEMCGNGIRCLARFAADLGIPDARSLAVDTPAGIVCTSVLGDGRVAVDMGEPHLSSDDVASELVRRGDDGALRLTDAGRDLTFVSMGNPHIVSFVDDLDFDWRAEGARLEQSPAFPNRTNVHFALRRGPRRVEVKVWERGCGETRACGTGACAVAVAGALEGALERGPIEVELPGGVLDIHWNEDGRVTMTGPAVTICRGTCFCVPPAAKR